MQRKKMIPIEMINVNVRSTKEQELYPPPNYTMNWSANYHHCGYIVQDEKMRKYVFHGTPHINEIIIKLIKNCQKRVDVDELKRHFARKHHVLLANSLIEKCQEIITDGQLTNIACHYPV